MLKKFRMLHSPVLPHIKTVAQMLKVSHKQEQDSLFHNSSLKGQSFFTHSVGFYAPHWNDRTSNRGRLQRLAVVTLVCRKIQIHRCHTRGWRVFTKLEPTENKYLIRKRDGILLAEFLYIIFFPTIYVVKPHWWAEIRVAAKKKKEI